MPRIPQEKIDEVRRSVDIVDVVGEYVSLKKQGRNYIARCPFHNDEHPSMSVSPDRQIFMCFVCHTGGNVFTFLQKHLNISYIEAVKKVAEMGHVDLSEYHIEETRQPIKRKNEALYEMHQEASKLYSYYLNTKRGLEAKTYLLKRHFDEDLMKRFQIGYAPMESVLYQMFNQSHYTEIDMVKSGLVIESQQHFDRFNDRIMFPLHNYQGEVIGFSGRIYKPTQHDSKYVNSPESEIFNKGKILYHYHQCRDAVKKAGFVYLLEGFMDVIAMYKAGIENTVALMGTAFTKDHIQALRHLTSTVYLCLDGDAAGQAAMSKAIGLLENSGLNVRLIILPDGKDPDEIYESDGQAGLENVLRKTLKPIEFMMEYEYQMIDIENYDDRKNYLEKMCKQISKLSDVVDRDYYIQSLSQKTGFSYSIIQEKIGGIKPVEQPQYSIYHEVKNTIHLVDKYKKAEHDLLFYMLMSKEVAMKYEAKAGFMYNDEYRVIASYIIDYYRKHSQLVIADFIDMIKKDHLVQIVLEISQSALPLPYEEQAINDYIRTIASNAKKLKKEQLLEQFHYVLDPTQKAEILNEIVKLGNEKESI